ncbi:hypothetical protein BSKO_09280 [Bryopsis sp. KO-2023]|nr:hypothetical protein BSKO_09280 [Bryopsis sp. KO-2023]
MSVSVFRNSWKVGSSRLALSGVRTFFLFVNETVRNLVDMLDKANAASAGSVDENGEHETSMSVLCPLNDTDLPVDASSLKTRQVEVTLRRLGSADVSVDDQLVCLEVLARLAWSDDSVRDEVANTGGIELIIKIMKQLPQHEGIQCNCCLALMSLVRGEGVNLTNGIWPRPGRSKQWLPP